MNISHVKFYAFVIAVFAVVASCKKDSSDNSPTSCSFGTNTVTTNSEAPVTYSASNQNSGTISSITYLGANGEVVVTSPTLPWTVTVTIPTGKPVNITAAGTAPAGGTLYLTYSIGYTNGIVSNTVGCGH